uniref:2-octaprenyl-6-methoxyphenol hydroxylase n=1 Tax=Herpetomonas muscarum TaxID=5718 RepID=T1YS48_HERMU|nr:2-octaprenyl-6-methoxyphenol hydroxylase [Herpetomonas muscarum]
MLRHSPRMLSTPQGYHDVVVSGGGLVGAAAMASLQQLRRHLHESSAGMAQTPETAGGPLKSLLMVDASKRPTFNAENMMHKLRTVSVTPVSSKILDNLGAWGKLKTKHSYYRMAVRHEQMNGPHLSQAERSQSFFMSSILGAKATAEPALEFTDLRKPVGFMCYNTELNSAMVDVVAETVETDPLAAGDKLLFESKLDSIKLPPSSVIGGPLGEAMVATAGAGAAAEAAKASLQYSLLLGCEGRGSPLRDVMSTASVQHDYAQVAFVSDVRIEKIDDGNVCAYQNFFRDGMIIAFLPMSEDSANIVFSTHPDHALKMMQMTQAELVEELNNRLHRFAPHDIPKILEVPEETVDGRTRRANGKFPLKLNFVTSPYTSRALLVGDAAHGIHPFAGQGLNLGIYDVCALADVMEKAIRAGQDIGSPAAVGQPYGGEMAAHTGPMIASMEAIKHLMHGLPGLSCLGMKALNELPVLSTFGKDAIFQVSSGATFAARHKGCFLLE